MKLRKLVFSIALAQTLALSGLLAADSPSDLDRVVVGKAAPAFLLKDGDGREHSLAARRGEPVIVVFYRGVW